MSLCSELENINISKDYFTFIKGIFFDYLQYIINYKSITTEYIKKLENLHDKYNNKLSGNDKDNTKYKNINTEHIFSLTSNLINIVEKQIENLKILMKGFNTQIENNNNAIKEKEILADKFQAMFEESRIDLLKKYREIDKLSELYKINMSNTEDLLYKYFDKKDNIIITEEQINSALSSTKKIEKGYKNAVKSSKLYEETFDSLYMSTLENFKKLSSETANQLKESIFNFLVLYKDSIKMKLMELEAPIQDLDKLDEVKEIEDIIIKSYSKKNKLIHVKADKYNLKCLQKEKENENNSYNSPILSLEDGFEEMTLIIDDKIINIIKKMKENFELIEDNNLNLNIEEEKLKCYQLTQKIINIEKQKAQKKNIPTKEEIDILNNLLDKHCNRVVFLEQLSEFRTKGKFEISQFTFDILSKLFITLIKNAEKSNDFHSVENAIIISQTYYMNLEKENKKIYLQKRIENNDIFKSKNFWEEFLDYCINKEIVKTVSNDVKNGNILKENRKDAEDKISNIAFGRIASYVKNMKDLGLDKESIIQIVFPKMEKFRLNKDLIELVNNIINNF